MDTDSVITAEATGAPRRTIPGRFRLLLLGGAIAIGAVLGTGAVAGSSDGGRDPMDGSSEATPVVAVAGLGVASTGDEATPARAKIEVAPAIHVDGPDVVADRIGGLAARLHDGNGHRVPGDVFLLMGREGSDDLARLYDDTPYTHDRAERPDTRASNEMAATVVSGLIGRDVPVVEMTSAPGGGPSGGAAYAIAYLNAASGGAFTGDVRVAATGGLSTLGYLTRVHHVDEKTVAANLADADVFFTSVAPSSTVSSEFGARLVGESVRDEAEVGGPGFHAPERVELFRSWGADQRAGTVDGTDIVDSRHLIDVAAYLCGAGSEFACRITDELVLQAQERDEYRLGQSVGADESERLRFRVEPSGDTTTRGDGLEGTGS